MSDFIYQQVSDELKETFPRERGFFVPSIKFCCSKNSKSSHIEANLLVST